MSLYDGGMASTHTPPVHGVPGQINRPLSPELARNQPVTAKVTRSTKAQLVREADTQGLSVSEHVSNILRDHCAADVAAKS